MVSALAAVHLLAEDEHRLAALLHFLSVVVVLGRTREQLKMRMRRGDRSNQRHVRLP